MYLRKTFAKIMRRYCEDINFVSRIYLKGNNKTESSLL